jgi:hypothetical protein
MKKKKTLTLSLEKRTISELNKSTQNVVHGGGGFGSYGGGCVVSIDVACKSASACHVCNSIYGC